MMQATQAKQALGAAQEAARAVGEVLRRNLHSTKKVIAEERQHDIKLELDVRCQKLIERTLRKRFPEIPVLGEEGVVGDPEAEWRWVVDPIDGTVNFTYGVPHACVAIALQRTPSSARSRGRRNAGFKPEYDTVVGVVYDPFCDEMWTAVQGGPAKLNGRTIRVSSRAKLEETIVTVGFAKYTSTLDIMLPTFNELVHRVRKIRIMGAAALAMTYVASGRFDAYIETGVRLWDIAAGGLILECAGGDFWRQAVDNDYTYRVIANNGRLRKKLQDLA